MRSLCLHTKTKIEGTAEQYLLKERTFFFSLHKAGNNSVVLFAIFACLLLAATKVARITKLVIRDVQRALKEFLYCSI